MQVIDIKKELKPLYQASPKSVVVVDVPPMNFLMVDGEGDPNTSRAFSDAIAALFALSYTLKFLIKRVPMEIDYKVMPLEGLWWADDMTKFTHEAVLIQLELTIAGIADGAVITHAEESAAIDCDI